MNIGQAIVLLIEKYEYAKKQDYIIKKVAWSLYQTWKEVDEKEEKQNDKGRSFRSIRQNFKLL